MIPSFELIALLEGTGANGVLGKAIDLEVEKYYINTFDVVG